MAAPIFDSIVTNTGASSTSFTPANLPTGYVNGDLIVFWVGQDGGSGTLSIATAGWSIHGTRTGTPAGAAFGSWFSTVVSGGTFNAPTFSSTLSEDWAGIGFIVRGAPSTSWVDVVGTQTDWNTAGNAAAGTPTTGTNGCLVLHGWVSDGSVQFRPDITDANLIAQYIANSQVSIAVTYRQQETAGAVDAMQMYFNKATEGGTQFTLCIKNDTNAKLAPDVRTTADLVSWYGDFSAASAALTWYGLEEATHQFAGGFTSGLLDGITVTTGAITVSTASQLMMNNVIGTDTIITTSTTDNRIDGGWHAHSGNLDGKTFTCEIGTSRNGLLSQSRIGALGLLVGFSDGTNYEIFRVKNSTKGWAAGTAYRVFIGCGTTTPTYSRGTLDWTAITQVAYLLHHKSTTADSLYLRNAFVIDRMTLTGGSSADPISSRDLFGALSQNSLVDIVGIRGKSQVQPTTKFQIGDATNTTHFANAATSTEFPQEWADAFTPNWQDGWHVGDSSVEVRIKPKSTDTIDLSAAIFATDTLQGLVYDSGGSSSATFTHTGCSVVGFSPVELLAGTTVTGKTYSGCGPIQTHGANLTNCTITDTLATASEAAVVVDTNGSTLDSCSIDVTGTSAGYALELADGVTAINMINCPITAGSTNKVHVLTTASTVAAGAFVTGDHYEIKTVGTTDFTAIGASANTIGVRFTATGAGSGTGDAYAAVKITTSGTTSLTEGEVTSAGAEIWVAAPQPTLDATVLANTRAVLWNRTTAAELDNTFVAGTTWSKVISSGASSGDVLDLYAFKEGYAEARSTIIYSGDDATFAVEQAVDTSIDYYRTQESITDYTTLTEYNFYAPDIYIQADDADGENKLKRLFIFYNGVLTTEDGARYMRGGVTFNSPFDVVINRSVRAIAVDNVSATYGLHFTDEDTIRVTTDDGTSWIAPPSAPGSIRYAFGVSPGQIETGVSGVTAQDITDIADAAATAVVGNSKTLTVPKFLGLK